MQRHLPRRRLARADAPRPVYVLLLLILSTLLGGALAFARAIEPPDPRPEPVPSEDSIEPLSSIPVPLPPNLNQFVQNREAAVALGKALFWDLHVGSDNFTACASCHFHAGADVRRKNQISPGILRVQANDPGHPYVFTKTPDNSFQVGGPNHLLTASDFPFVLHADERVPSPVTLSRNDAASSLGVHLRFFLGVNPGKPDDCEATKDPVFQVGGVNTRRVEPRNTPTMINAVFNIRNFWDGRARDVFNGADPFGKRSNPPQLIRIVNGVPTRIPVLLPFASLASQATGPGVSDFEMSCAAKNGGSGRILAHIGKKLLRLDAAPPLQGQAVALDDSVLGAFVNPTTPAAGLTVTYRELIAKAFRPEWWQRRLGPVLDTVADQGFLTDVPLPDPRPGGEKFIARPTERFTVMEYNFSLFFGIAVMLYEATLVSDDAPIDRFLQGNPGAMSPSAINGLALFKGKAKCIACHKGAEFTGASVRRNRQVRERIEFMVMGNDQCAVYDQGFYNISVLPTPEDLGVGGRDPFDAPLSETCRRINSQSCPTINAADPRALPAVPGPAPTCENTTRAAVAGAFKTPGLRNAELTGPYFHTGGKATLKQVVDFYNRGGDFPHENRNDIDPDIEPLGLSESEKTDLVNFLIALTDERVRFEREPFDHPQLCIPDGHVGDENQVKEFPPGYARDDPRCVAEVGKNGRPAPLGTFLDLDPQSRTK